MVIGINASAAFKPQRTGVEEYTHQLMEHLSKLDVAKHQVILYVDNKFKCQISNVKCRIESDFIKIKGLTLPFMWTQLRLSLEMLMRRPDILFIPVHVLPLVHPQKSIVTIHGLEYEYFPEMYPLPAFKYLRWSTRYALKHAYKIITVSENTKRDLIRLYGGEPEKIEVVYHGVNKNQKLPKIPKSSISKIFEDPRFCNKIKDFDKIGTKFKNYILYLGRIEKKKNVDRLVRAFDIVKQKYRVPHKLILAGPHGYRFKEIEQVIKNSKAKDDIIMTGYVSEEEKCKLLKNADEFVFPSLYEGFGMPVLEAQSAGVPVVTSNISSLPEIVGESALKVNPLNTEEIAESIYKVISNDRVCKALISQGYENIKRFSWERCARETFKILLDTI